MEKKETRYSIIKVMGNKEVKVIDTHCEVLEFDNYDEAKEMADIMETNSDSGYKYRVNEI